MIVEILADSDDQLTGRNLLDLGKADRLNDMLVGDFECQGARFVVVLPIERGKP